MSKFYGNFCLDEVKKFLPKITTIYVSNDMTDGAF